MMRQKRGLTMVELLVTVAILGILLAVGGFFLTSTMRVTTHQGQLASAAGDVRLAMFRISEVARQAGYIYPPGVQLTVAGAGTFTTGPSALALLVPAGTTYCMETGQRYCGFLYYVGERAPFVPPLPANGPTGFALGEIRVTDIEWPKSVVPAIGVTSWPAGSRGLLADGIVEDRTDLGNDVRLSTLEAIYDDPLQFRYASDALGQRSLLNGVNVTVELSKQSLGRSADSRQSLEIFTRAVPRSAPANLD